MGLIFEMEPILEAMLEPIENQYIQIGYIARSHGVEGDVLIIPEIYAPTLFDVLDLVHISNARGDLVPARVESVRVQEKNNRLSFFVKFEHVTDRTQAEELKNFPVYATRETVEDLSGTDNLPPDLTTFEVWADGKHYGSVKGVIDTAAHLILEVITDQQEDLLIPLVEEYIVDIDEESKQIQCKNLERLRDL